MQSLSHAHWRVINHGGEYINISARRGEDIIILIDSVSRIHFLKRQAIGSCNRVIRMYFRMEIIRIQGRKRGNPSSFDL